MKYREKVVVIGTGYVGLPAALMWAKAGLTVVGVDINENLVSAINERTLLLNEQELRDLLADPEVQSHLIAQHTPTQGDVFVIAVPTPVDPLRKVADLAAVRDAVQAIAPFLRPGNLVILESTVPPATCRSVVKPLLEQLTGLKVPEQIMLAHCPERILPGDIFKEIVWNDRLIGGMDLPSSEAAAQVYRRFVRGQLFITNDLVAELSKLMENTYRDVNIALANEFSLICEALGVDAREVIAFANHHPRVDILSPGIGVGGHCIPVDPWFLKEVAPHHSRLITAARLINDEMPTRVAQRIRVAVKDLPAPRIVALGASYKRNCEDLRESPALQVVEQLRAEGCHVDHYDPLVPDMRYASLAEVARGADLLVVLVAHNSISAELARDRALVEGAMRQPRILELDR